MFMMHGGAKANDDGPAIDGNWSFTSKQDIQNFKCDVGQ